MDATLLEPSCDAIRVRSKEYGQYLAPSLPPLRLDYALLNEFVEFGLLDSPVVIVVSRHSHIHLSCPAEQVQSRFDITQKCRRRADLLK